MLEESASFRKRFLQIESLHRAQQHYLVLEYGRDLLANYSSYVPLLRILGFSALEIQEYQLAEHYFFTALKYDSREQRALYAIALCYQKQGKKGQATKYYRTLVSIQAHEPEDYQCQYDASLKLGDKKEILRILEEALSRYPTSPPRSDWWRAAYMEYLGKPTKAEVRSRIKQNFQEVPSLGAVLLYLQMCKTYRYWDEGYSIIRKTKSLHGENEEWKRLSREVLGGVIYGRSVPQAYWENFKYLGHDVGTYLQIGSGLAQSCLQPYSVEQRQDGKTTQALDFLMAASFLDPQNLNALAMVVDVLIVQREFDLADNILSSYKGSDPGIAARRAKLVFMRGEVTESLKMFEELLNDASNHLGVLEQYCRVLYMYGDLERASKVLTEILSVPGREAQWSFLKLLIEQQRGQTERAEKTLLDLQQIYPESAFLQAIADSLEVTDEVDNLDTSDSCPNSLLVLTGKLANDSKYFGFASKLLQAGHSVEVLIPPDSNEMVTELFSTLEKVKVSVGNVQDYGEKPYQLVFYVPQGKFLIPSFNTSGLYLAGCPERRFNRRPEMEYRAEIRECISAFYDPVKLHRLSPTNLSSASTKKVLVNATVSLPIVDAVDVPAPNQELVQLLTKKGYEVRVIQKGDDGQYYRRQDSIVPCSAQSVIEEINLADIVISSRSAPFLLAKALGVTCLVADTVNEDSIEQELLASRTIFFMDTSEDGSQLEDSSLFSDRKQSRTGDFSDQEIFARFVAIEAEDGPHLAVLTDSPTANSGVSYKDPKYLTKSFSAYPNDFEVMKLIYRSVLDGGRTERAKEILAYIQTTYPNRAEVVEIDDRSISGVMERQESA